ncbi:ninjurin-2 isoform X1 [Anomalospiza imberbis]|uniref:ninjurin-2 isoform X1 n=2 Tax=Anomalospiza imberbis TaxID=187417 RepID=UPI00358EA172
MSQMATCHHTHPCEKSPCQSCLFSLPDHLGHRAQDIATLPHFTLQGMNPHLRINGPMNINHYATKKSVAESMLDVALFMANVTQLKAVLEQGTAFQYYATLIVLISISLFFQVMIGILLIITARLNLNDIAKQPRLNILNNAATALIFITVILNIFITAFGVQKTGLYPTRNFGPY